MMRIDDDDDDDDDDKSLVIMVNLLKVAEHSFFLENP